MLKQASKSISFKTDDSHNQSEHFRKNISSMNSVEDAKQDGGWGWVVLICSFFCIFIIDGVAYTYGAFFLDISKDLKVGDSLVALINSIQLALYFILSPLASAVINTYGFRTCTMSGAIIMCVSLISSYFAPNYILLLICYGIFGGLGCALINMAAGLVAGFYFVKLRSLALAITSVGSSAGISAMFPINRFLVKLGGWRCTILLYSGFCGIIYFLGMTFKPLVSLTIVMAEEDHEDSSSRKLTNTPSESTNFILRAISNVTLIPTAASTVLEDVRDLFTEPGPSTSIKQTERPEEAQLKQDSRKPSSQSIKKVQSIFMSLRRKEGKTNLVETKKQRNFWSRLFHRKPHGPQSRSFCQDNLKSLSTYKINKASSDTLRSFEYEMAVTSLHERDRTFTGSVRRLFTSMIDTTILKKCSFQLLCSSNLIAHLGTLVPYVYLGDRNENAGVDPKHCAFFVSVLGISNAIGKISLSALSLKIEALKIYSVSIIIAGASTIASTLSYNLVYQYMYSAIFGFFISSLGVMKSIVLVSLFGLDKLTNSTGMLLIFIGLGNLFSTPLAGVFKERFGYDIAFWASGLFLTIGGIFTIPIRNMVKKENNSSL